MTRAQALRPVRRSLSSRPPCAALLLCWACAWGCSPKETTVPPAAPASAGPAGSAAALAPAPAPVPVPGIEAVQASAPGPERGDPPPGRAQALPPATGSNSPCAADSDCTGTYYADGACCPLLCSARAVTKRAAAAQAREVEQCANVRACPKPLCRPPLFETRIACVEGRCLQEKAGGPPERR